MWRHLMQANSLAIKELSPLLKVLNPTEVPDHIHFFSDFPW